MARGFATVNDAGTGPAAWYQALPPITKFYATACFAVTVITSLQLFDARYLVLHWPLVYKNYEVWRLATNFFCIGGFSLKFVMRMIWILQYGAALETQVYQFEPADYLFMYIFCALGMLAASVIPTIGLMTYGTSMIFVLIYIWSKNFPDQQVSIYGLFKIMSFYVPFAFVAIELLLGADIRPGCIGIAVGHLYYFLYAMYPQTSGTQLIKTPESLKHWLANRGVGSAPRPNAAAPTGFSAFRGSGRRLGSS